MLKNGRTSQNYAGSNANSPSGLGLSKYGSSELLVL